MTEENKTIRELKVEKCRSARARLGNRPNYPDTPEQIAETEAFIKAMTPLRNQAIASQEPDPEI